MSAGYAGWFIAVYCGVPRVCKHGRGSASPACDTCAGDGQQLISRRRGQRPKTKATCREGAKAPESDESSPKFQRGLGGLGGPGPVYPVLGLFFLMWAEHGTPKPPQACMSHRASQAPQSQCDLGSGSLWDSKHRRFCTFMGSTTHSAAEWRSQPTTRARLLGFS